MVSSFKPSVNRQVRDLVVGELVSLGVADSDQVDMKLLVLKLPGFRRWRIRDG